MDIKDLSLVRIAWAVETRFLNACLGNMFPKCLGELD